MFPPKLFPYRGMREGFNNDLHILYFILHINSKLLAVDKLI